jgi:hypothetical protein
MNAAPQRSMKHWIAVASAEHVRYGREKGFMQVCHGKRGPLARLMPGDGVVYYSPSEAFRGASPCQAFTAIGIVKPGDPYQVAMSDDFRPYRRDVAWWPSQDAAIRPLLHLLEFTQGKRNWGYQFRYGLFGISDADFVCILNAMFAGNAAGLATTPQPSSEVQ